MAQNDSAGPTLERDPLLGTLVDDYQILARLGAGGMGVVYRGVHVAIQKPVAIKILSPTHLGGPAAREELLAEARAAAAVRHRGIVDVSAFGELPDGQPYLVMELLEGEPLDAVLRRTPQLPCRRALTILDELLEALSVAHASGVIHRDLKPSNVFLVRPPRVREYVKILDFGLAKRTTVEHGRSVGPSVTGTICGSPLYMAPEQGKGERVSARADLYSVGCLAFEMLGGRPPFEGRTVIEAISMHLTAPVPRVSTWRPDVPRELDDLLYGLMQKEPALRPHSANAVREMIAELLPSLPAEAPAPAAAPLQASLPGASAVEDPTFRRSGEASLPPPSRDVPGPAGRRSKAPAAVIGAIAAFGLAGAGYAFSRWQVLQAGASAASPATAPAAAASVAEPERPPEPPAPPVAAAAVAAAPVAPAASAAQPARPEARPAAPQDFSGTYAGESEDGPVVVLLRQEPGGRVTGTLSIDGESTPLSGTAEGRTLRGTADEGGLRFDFTAALQGERLTVSAAGGTHVLTRSRAAHAAAGQPPSGATGAPSVTINGVALDAAQLARLQQTYGIRFASGSFWYDGFSGAWGNAGGPTVGRVAPGLPMGGKLRRDASSGNTGVIVNGRELPALEVAILQQGGPVYPGRYWIDAQGNYGFEGGPLLGNLFARGQAPQGQRQGILSTYDKTGAAVIGGD